MKRRTGTRGVGNEKGNVVGLQAIACGGDKRSKRVATDEIAQTSDLCSSNAFGEYMGSTLFASAAN